MEEILYSRKFLLGENFHLFRPGASWAKLFRRIILPSENFVTPKFFTRTGFCTWLPSSTSSLVPRDHQSAVLPGIQNLFSICSLA